MQEFDGATGEHFDNCKTLTMSVFFMGMAFEVSYHNLSALTPLV